MAAQNPNLLDDNIFVNHFVCFRIDCMKQHCRSMEKEGKYEKNQQTLFSVG